jgi:uncharacterized membrane protein YdjX (TVP38/TMEM64 family)
MTRWLRNYWKPIAVVLLLGALCTLMAIFPVKEWVKTLTYVLRGYGAFGMLLFVVVYAASTVGFLPGSLFTFAAGLIYGIWVGTAIALIGATIGAALAFLVSRYLFRNWMHKMIARKEKLRALDQAIARRGWKIILLLRLSPLIPFSVSNYFYGVTAIRFWPYVGATLAGMIPGAFGYSYLGRISQIGLEAGQGSDKPWLWLSLRVGGFVVACVWVNAIVRKELAKFVRENGAGKN